MGFLFVILPFSRQHGRVGTKTLWLLLVTAFVGANILKEASKTATQENYLVPPPEYVEYFHFGFRESLADSFWLRWIQDSDTCQTYLAPVIYNSEQKNKGLPTNDLVSIPRHKVCDNSWTFKMLDAVTKLSPKFEMPYLAGASALAILVEDYVGAGVIYERGLREYPKNWQLLYRAAFHFQFNMKDLPRAADLLVQAADFGGPLWIRSLASRLYSKAGQVEMGLSVLVDYRRTLDPKNEEGVRAVEERIAELKLKLVEQQNRQSHGN